MKRKKWMVPAIMAALLMAAACTPAKKYERQLRRGLASGIRYDSLFMGLSLGMTDMEFFDACWKLNEDSLVRQAIDNRSVEYVMEDELNYPATMNFYPVFAEGKIVELPVRFIYHGWSPWNKEQSASNLALDVKQWYEKIYGKGFITIEHPFRGKAYTKIDGNRRITIYIESDQFVWGVFTDMSAEAARDSLRAEKQY
jgi:hypothetical protein